MDVMPEEVVREVRRHARIDGISLAMLSRRCGVPYERLQRLLRRQRKPRVEETEQILAAVGLAPERAEHSQRGGGTVSARV